LDVWSGELAEPPALPDCAYKLWGEAAGVHVLSSVVKLADAGGVGWPITGMAATEPEAPAANQRFAVSSPWGAVSAGQIVTRTTGGNWYVTVARIGTLFARLDVPGTFVQWNGSAWDTFTLLDEATLAEIGTVGDLVAAVTAALAALNAVEIPEDLDDIGDSTTRYALSAANKTKLDGAAAEATPETLVFRDSSGRFQAAAGQGPSDVVVMSQLGGTGTSTTTTDVLRFVATSGDATPLTADETEVVDLDSEDFDRFSDLSLASGAVLLPAGEYRAFARALFLTTAEDMVQAVYRLRIAHNASSEFVELNGDDVPQFGAPDADAGKQAMLVWSIARFTLSAPASVRLQATSSADGAVAAGALLEIEQLKVSVAGGGAGGAASYGAADLLQVSDGAGGFTSDPQLKIDRVYHILRVPRLQRSCVIVTEPVWTGRAASLVAPSSARQAYLTCVNTPQPIEATGGDVVLTVTAPASFAAGADGSFEDFELIVKNGHATNQMRVVMSGFAATGAVARQLRLWPGDSGVLRYWRQHNGATQVWHCEGVPMIMDRIEVDWDPVANQRLVIPPRGLMRLPAWVSDQFFGYAPAGGPTATTVFTLQERIDGVWTNRYVMTFPAANQFGAWTPAPPITTANFLGLLAPAALNGIVSITGGMNVGIVTAG